MKWKSSVSRRPQHTY